MAQTFSIVLFTLAAGACIPLGGLIAARTHLRPRWLENEFRHAVIAFGGGIMLAAVALVLVPEGVAYTDHPLLSTLVLIAGGASFFALERLLGARKREKPQFLAMLLDFVPESLALGGIFAVGASTAPLLALFIGLQNLPEGFNAFRELRAAKDTSDNGILLLMTAMIPIGPLFGLLGFYYFSHNSTLLGGIMLFAAGGILYLLFQDIAPQSRMQKHWAPPLGAVLGFSAGMLGNNLIG